jgi:uncharacterized protein YvpB
MSQSEVQRRHSAPALVWLAFSLVLALVAGLVFVALMTWQRTQQVDTLLLDLEALRAEQRGMVASQLALERRLATLEARLPDQPSADDSQEMQTLRTSLAELAARGNDLEAMVQDLAGRTTALEALEQAGGQETSEPVPPQARLAVARQQQTHSLSCESSAASMVAQYHGVPLSEADILAALPRHDNPYLGFRGNVDGPTGSTEDYGVYAAPIMAILNDRGLQAWQVQAGLAGIRAAIARGHPVIAWVTYNCLPSVPTTVTIDSEIVTLVPYQHAVVVIGYSPEGFWANDPYDGQEDFYPTADFERAMTYFGHMAIEVAAP